MACSHLASGGAIIQSPKLSKNQPWVRSWVAKPGWWGEGLLPEGTVSWQRWGAGCCPPPPRVTFPAKRVTALGWVGEDGNVNLGVEFQILAWDGTSGGC